MAAQRLGSILTNVTGTAGQLLRVNSGETGFEFVEPATIPTYTVTNKTEDRIINADDVTLDEVADVLSTLIDDLAAAGLTAGGAALETFQWSASEQVWPFEKASNGATLYAKEINFGSLPNSGYKYVVHNITGFNAGDDLIRMETYRRISSTYAIQIPFPYQGGASFSLWAGIDGANIVMATGGDHSAETAIVRMIYKKSV